MKIRKEDNCTVTVTIIKARQQPREGHTSPVGWFMNVSVGQLKSHTIGKCDNSQIWEHMGAGKILKKTHTYLGLYQ